MAMACCFACDSTRHCMPMRCMHDDPPRVRPRIMQQAIRHKASSHIPVNPLLYQARASRVWYARFVAMACPFACLLFKLVTASHTHCSTQALLAQGSRGFCVRTSCGHASCSRPSDTSKASSHKPPSPLFPTMLQHPESGMQNVVLWHDVLRACFSRTSPYCVHRGVYPLYVVIGTFEIKRVYPPCVATRDFLKTF